jgi:hypothetical protein
MPPQHGRKLAILQRRQRVSDLYLQGRPLHAISDELHVPMTTLWRDLKAIQKDWRDSAVRNFDQQVEEELQKLELVEREAWEAWERSKKPAQEASARDHEPGRGTKRIKSRHGDMRCLDVILKCSDARRELLNLNPHKPQVTIQADNVRVDVQSELRKELLYEPAYLDYLRSRALDADARAVCQDGQPAALDAAAAPRLPGPSDPGSDSIPVQAATGDDAPSAR